MYELVIFDLDGTLIDSVGDIADALNRVLGTTHSDEEVAGWVGNGVQELLTRAGAPSDLTEMARLYRADYAAHPVVRTRPYLGVRETLGRIDCFKAIATNKPGQISRTIVEKLGLADQFVAVLGEDDVGARKPDPLIVDVVRGKVGIPRAQTLYVGDSLVDAATAQAAGVDLCLVTYGYADPAQIRAYPAKYHVERFSDVAQLVSA